MPHTTAPKLTAAIVLGLTLAAVAVPTVQARIAVDPPDVPASVDLSDIPAWEIGSPPVPAGDTTASVKRPDDRASVRGPGAAPDNASARNTASADGFDWTDALLGAAIGIVGVLLGAVAFLVSRRRGRLTRVLVGREGQLR